MNRVRRFFANLRFAVPVITTWDRLNTRLEKTGTEAFNDGREKGYLKGWEAAMAAKTDMDSGKENSPTIGATRFTSTGMILSAVA